MPTVKSFLTKIRRKTDNSNILDLGDKPPLEEKYELLDTLGKGTFSVVRLGVCKETKEKVAVKVIEKGNLGVKPSSLRTEVAVLRAVQHPSVVNLRDVFEDEGNVWLVMDLMVGGELFDRICEDHPNGYSEAVSQRISKRLLEVMSYLHSKGIIHRDLKPENLLCSGDNDEDVRVSDFGLAKIWKADMVAKTACGSPNYVAPEVLANDGLTGYTTAVDMWSVGVIIYVILCGFCPFYDDQTQVLYKLISTGKYNFPSPYWDGISEEAKDLVKNLLVLEPTKRMTADQALQHPWIKGQGVSDEAIANINSSWGAFRKTRGRN